MLRVAFLLVFSGLLAGAVLRAEELSSDQIAKINQVFAEWDKPGSPGCALGVIKDGQWLFKRGYGYANLEYDIPISENSVFRIASTSKQFTAAAIALLAEEGKISLDDDIRKYLPELPAYKNTITIRHLVHHTSGIRDYLGLMGFGGAREDDFYTNEDALAKIARQKDTNFPAGEQHLYSNSGYFLFGIIIKRASGLTLAQYADKHIFKPLGMDHTHFQDNHKTIVKNRASGYEPTETGFQINMTTLDMVGDGGVFTTLEDLKKWDANFYNNRLGKGSPEFLTLLQTPGKLNDGTSTGYAFGLNIDTYHGRKTVSHGGAFVGFRAQMVRFPEERLTIIVLANVASFRPSSRNQEVADIIVGTNEVASSATIPAPPRIEPDPRWLDAVQGTWLDGDGNIMTTAVLDGRLFRQIKGLPNRELFATSELDYSYDGLALDIHFRRDPSGNIDSFELDRTRSSGPSSFYTRLLPFKPEADFLKSLVGSYYSEELDVTYRLYLEEGQLKIKIPGQGDSALEMLLKDQFFSEAGFSGKLVVENQKVQGFLFQAGRIRNILFSRKDS